MHGPRADGDRDGQHDRGGPRPCAQRRREPTAEEGTPAHDRRREQRRIAQHPHRPRPHLAELGGRLRGHLAAANLALPSLAEQVGEVLEEDRVEAIAAVEVIAHVDGENGDVGYGEDSCRDPERPAQHHSRAREAHERDGGGDDGRNGQRGQHAEAGGDEIRA